MRGGVGRELEGARVQLLADSERVAEAGGGLEGYRQGQVGGFGKEGV